MTDIFADGMRHFAVIWLTCDLWSVSGREPGRCAFGGAATADSAARIFSSRVRDLRYSYKPVSRNGVADTDPDIAAIAKFCTGHQVAD